MGWVINVLVFSNAVTLVLGLFFYWRWREADKLLRALSHAIVEAVRKHHHHK